MTYKMDSEGMPRHVHECEECKPTYESLMRDLETSIDASLKLKDDLLETIRWMAQTVHNAHHSENSGSSFKECPKNTCNAAKQALAKAKSK